MNDGERVTGVVATRYILQISSWEGSVNYEPLGCHQTALLLLLRFFFYRCCTLYEICFLSGVPSFVRDS